MCGRCLSEHYPLAYSFDVNCVADCSHLGEGTAYLPLTLFCFFVLFFEINVPLLCMDICLWHTSWSISSYVDYLVPYQIA